MLSAAASVCAPTQPLDAGESAGAWCGPSGVGWSVGDVTFRVRSPPQFSPHTVTADGVWSECRCRRREVSASAGAFNRRNDALFEVWWT